MNEDNKKEGAAPKTGDPPTMEGAPRRQRLDRYRAELLRWNSQFNLIARTDPGPLLGHLVLGCRESLASLQVAVSAFDPGVAHALGGNAEPAGSPARIVHADIGSGAGLPGLVWHILGEWAIPARTTLYEPRGKRAWFLERCIRLLNLSDVDLQQRRWGESSPRGLGQGAAPTGGTLWLISLQKLHLPEPRLLAGWREETGLEDLPEGDKLLVVRPRRGDEALPADLAHKLQLRPQCQWREGDPIPREHAWRLVSDLAGEDMGLLISYYRRRLPR